MSFSRRLTFVALVVTAVISGAYVFGRGGGKAPHAVHTAQTAAPKAGAPSATMIPPVKRGPIDTEDDNIEGAVPHRPPLPAEHGGPFGSRMTTGGRNVALTFDDGPNPVYTPKVLALLRKYHVKATFCVLGSNARKYPSLVRAIVAGGHTLCNHSWNHDLKLGRRSTATIRADLRRTNAAIEAASPGARISYFRQPGGEWTARVVKVAREFGMTPLHWAVDPQDWRRPPASTIASRVIKATYAGAVVLMHDAGGDRGHTISALRVILPNLTKRFHLAALPPGYDVH